MSKNMGIYRIINIVNGKFYLGSSNDLRKRKREHIWALRKGAHINDYLQKAFNKYGEKNFIFEVLEYVNNESDLRKIEQYYLDLLKPCDCSIGYNLCEDSRGGGLSGENNPNYQKPMSNEQKLAISKTLKGHLVSDETRKKISKARKGKYAGEKHPMYGKPVPEERRKLQSILMKGKFAGKNNPSAKAVVQLSLNDEFIKRYDTMEEACKNVKIHKSNLCKCCKGKYNTTGGYKWMYYDDYLKYKNKQKALAI